MRSTFYGFEIAKTGLFVSQRQLDITGHNISNVDTTGYSRQRLDTSAVPPSMLNGLLASNDRGESGRGTNIVCVEQIRNPFLDRQFRTENTTYNYWGSMETEFYMVESLFNGEITESNSQPSKALQNFYSSLYKLANGNASEVAIRGNVLESARALIETMTYNANKIQEQFYNINKTIETNTTKINTIIKQIAQLNEQIFGYELSGAKANDLRDSRNLLLDSLSGYIDVNYHETDEGYMVVQFDGRDLVKNGTYKELAIVENAQDKLNPDQNVFNIYWKEDLDTAGVPKAGTSAINITKGAMGGYFQMRDGDSAQNVGIPHIMSLMDDMVRKVVADFNMVHMQGWTLATDTEASKQGVKFFEDFIGSNTRIQNFTFDPATGKVSFQHLDTSGNVLQTYTDVDYNDKSIRDILFSDLNARNFKMNDDVDKNSYLIAASDQETGANTDNEQRGNNVNANKLLGLIWQQNSGSNAETFDGAYKTMITAIGSQMDQISRMTTSQYVILNQVDTQRVSISGVSIDEEMTNVIRFGHSYNAASRVITAIDEELDMLINRMGLVGRS